MYPEKICRVMSPDAPVTLLGTGSCRCGQFDMTSHWSHVGRLEGGNLATGKAPREKRGRNWSNEAADQRTPRTAPWMLAAPSREAQNSSPGVTECGLLTTRFNFQPTEW